MSLRRWRFRRRRRRPRPSGARRLRLLLLADRNDLQDRVLLAMPVAAAIVVTAALLEDDDLLALLLRDNLGRNGQPVGGLQPAAVTGKQPVRQRHDSA